MYRLSVDAKKFMNVDELNGCLNPFVNVVKSCESLVNVIRRKHRVTMRTKTRFILGKCKLRPTIYYMTLMTEFFKCSL